MNFYINDIELPFYKIIMDTNEFEQESFLRIEFFTNTEKLKKFVLKYLKNEELLEQENFDFKINDDVFNVKILGVECSSFKEFNKKNLKYIYSATITLNLKFDEYEDYLINKLGVFNYE